MMKSDCTSKEFYIMQTQSIMLHNVSVNMMYDGILSEGCWRINPDWGKKQNESQIYTVM